MRFDNLSRLDEIWLVKHLLIYINTVCIRRILLYRRQTEHARLSANSTGLSKYQRKFFFLQHF